MMYHDLPLCAVQQVLDEFQEQFIEDMDFKDVVLDLLYHGIISRGDQRTITRTEDPTEQNFFLHYCLKQKCTEDAFHCVCDIISGVKGNPKMSALGTAMKKRLEKGSSLSLSLSLSLSVSLSFFFPLHMSHYCKREQKGTC